jgi:glutaminase
LHSRSAIGIHNVAGVDAVRFQHACDPTARLSGVPSLSGCRRQFRRNTEGITIWSPRLDAIGNSARGVHAATELCKRFQLNNFEVFSGLSRTKVDPTKRKNAGVQDMVGGMLFAASQGDVQALESHQHAGTDLHATDYDMRTALHLAAAEGHTDAVKFLASTADAAALNAVDRWGGTPLSDAENNNHADCIAILKAAGAIGSASAHKAGVFDGVAHADAPSTLYAAADGDVDELIKLNASGTPLFGADYDGRTALHLAASNGHDAAVGYLLAQSGVQKAAILGAKDRWGGTALDDAARGNHAGCSAQLA